MTYLSFIEKFKILFELIFDFKFILVFMIVLILLTLLYGIRRLSAMKYILFMIMSFIIVLIISIINNYKVLSDTFDNFTTIFFGNIYFPSIYVYIGVLVISFISFLTSLLNKMMYKVYKVINTIMFVINNFLFVIVLNIIAKNKIDIFSIDSLYTNTSLVAILELSMGLCVLWFLSLMAAYITNVIGEKLSYKKINSSEKVEVFNSLLEVNVNMDNSFKDINADSKIPVLIEQISCNKELIDYQITEEDDVYAFDNNMSEENVINQTIYVNEEVIVGNTTLEENVNMENNSLTFNDILNGCVPVNYYDNNIAVDEYTLFDPQKMYEYNYNKTKSENLVGSDILKNDLREKNEADTFDCSILTQEDIKDNNVLVDNLFIDEKENIVEERLCTNTVSLNDLIDDEEVNIYEVSNTDDKNDYTVEDYKKMAEMLNVVKSYTNNSNINIDDAVAISLIKNYSIEECLKFKNILENSLN